ncbi:hypothetical protein CBM2634_A170106 [Cupriavidus taiwanensis]|uniref:Uncharacterized protein n=1 Tax=Cupriavidus taiwanensis TaxID=164546 RepID=A0A375J132_9BURK|nr:hypothetical protein CBM2634_A170106 [Cupriavidus taiwanensis]
MIGRIYARLVLWLIAPAIAEHHRRLAQIGALEKSRWVALGFRGAFQAAQMGDAYWRARGYPGGFQEVRERLSQRPG